MTDHKNWEHHLYGYVGAQHYEALDALPEDKAHQLNQLLEKIEEATFRVIYEAKKLDLGDTIEGALGAIISEQSEAAADTE